MEKWFIPALEDFPSQRALLHFGLNKAVRYYRELIVPGISGVRFVHQLSWAVAGIKLAEDLNYKPAKIANAIEALASKLEWNQDREGYHGKGKRAFQRNRDAWNFKQLSTKQYYVQITYRMATVRALTGLGLATGTRFNSMKLTPTGNELAEKFLSQKGVGKGGGTLENALKNWIQGKNIPKSGKIVECLCKTKALPDEKKIVLDRLFADDSSSSRRKELIEAFGRSTVDMPDIEIIKKKLMKRKQADYVKDIETAMAFDEMLDCARMLIYQKAEQIYLNNTESLAETLNDFRHKIDLFLKTTGKKYSDAENFVAEMEKQKNDTALLEKLVTRDGNILMLANNKIVKGPLFDHRKDIKNDSPETENQNVLAESSTINKINQFFTLWRDCK